jgi:hypothetical protein
MRASPHHPCSGGPAPACLCTAPLACKLHALTMSCRSVAPLCGDVLPFDTGKVTAWPVPKRMAMSRIFVAFEASRPSLPPRLSRFFGACSGRRFPVRTRAAMCMPQPADHAEAAPRSAPRQTHSSDIWLQTSGFRHLGSWPARRRRCMITRPYVRGEQTHSSILRDMPWKNSLPEMLRPLYPPADRQPCGGACPG